MPLPTPESTPPVFSLRAHWLAETVRLREARWGLLEDASECRRARALGGNLAQRILLRAQWLAQREGLSEAVTHWQKLARLALLALLLLAMLAGGSAALAALGDNLHPVNLAVALLALLGLHALTFVFWLFSLMLPGRGESALLGKVWLWIANKLARGPNQTLPATSLVEWLGRYGLLRWAFGSISQLTWLVALLAQVVVLLLALAAKRYDFTWETTLLPPGFFIALTQLLGWLPAQLGFALPSPEVVQNSINTPASVAADQALWSSWLLGCIVVYGIAPRLLALVYCLCVLRRRLPQLAIDEAQPGYAELRPRLMPASEPIGIDAQPGASDAIATPRDSQAACFSTAPLVIGFELAEEATWPPLAIPNRFQVGPNITQRDQREALLQQMHRQAPGTLVLVLDGNQTPDRGSLAFLQEAHALAGKLHIVLLSGPEGPARRLAQWHQALDTLPAPKPQCHDSLNSALDALAHAHA